ncbi:hypothetical protein QQ020_35275 [Fulvivirgaceae bacterium BMA12]|uniref:Outer membrane protein beta-barrel domain-containing protein n=1 Tax=Agaribacillus aureus TaxID=3051825 RepID=A0ABT8LHV0_9BACT|nr:hypothetical protein [Fulvivirgaceae bacterium BMA12]
MNVVFKTKVTSIIAVTLLILGGLSGSNQLKAQEIGVSASFFIPKNGYFSAPISPISFRGFGINITDYLSVETGVTLYRMSGLNVKSLPFESKKPLIGPTFTLLVPLELVLEFGNNDHVFRIKGGGFTFFNFDQKINEGNLDRALIPYTGWQVANSDFEADNNIGFGIHFGGEYIFYLKNNFGISMGGYYYIGQAEVNLSGTITGGDETGINIMETAFPGSEVDFTGFEISLGILFSTN